MTASVPYSFTVPMGTPVRQLDPVRAAALAQAVNLCRQDSDTRAREVVEIAELFEAYLAGEEAS